MNDQPNSGKKEEEKKKGFVPAPGAAAGAESEAAIGAAADAAGSAGAASGAGGAGYGAAGAACSGIAPEVIIAAKIASTAGGGLFAGKGAVIMAAAILCATAGTYLYMNGPHLPGSGAFSSDKMPGGQMPGMNGPQGSGSSLDMFRDTNKGLIGEEANAAAEDDKVKGAAGAKPAAGSKPGGRSGDDTAADSGAAAAAGALAEAGRLMAAGGFGSPSGGGGGGTASSGLVGPGSSVKPPPAAQGVASAMKGSPTPAAKGGASKISAAAKKGAFGQAKFASSRSQIAAKAPYEAAKSGAGEAFGGQAGAGGAGITDGGAGISGGGDGGSGLKASDPNTNASSFTPPKPEVPEATDVSPWNKYTKMIMYAIIAWLVLLMIAKALAKSANPWMQGLAKFVAILAAAAAGVVIYAGWKLVSESGQKLMGYGAMALGAIMAFMALKELFAKDKGSGAAQEAIDKGQESQPSQLLNNQMQQSLSKLTEDDKDKDKD